MDLKSEINSRTRIDKDKIVSDVIWTKKNDKRKKVRPPRPRGEKPYQMEMQESHMNSTYNDKQETRQEENPPMEQHEVEFAGIIPNVREVTGGYNMMSNEFIENRYRERQKRFAKKSSDVSSSSSSTYITACSNTTDSYKTAHTYSSESTITSNNEYGNGLYKKNAAMRGLAVQDAHHDSFDKDNSIFSVDASDVSDPVTGVQDSFVKMGINEKNHEDDEKAMHELRISLLMYPSKEDEDILYHPLKEKIQDDQTWRNFRLSRKGTETFQTPRQYFLNLEDDDFNFQPRPSK